MTPCDKPPYLGDQLITSDGVSRDGLNEFTYPQSSVRRYAGENLGCRGIRLIVDMVKNEPHHSQVGRPNYVFRLYDEIIAFPI